MPEAACVRYRQWPVDWCDNPRLRGASDWALRVYLYIATGPCMTLLMGVCRVGLGEIADALLRDTAEVEQAIQELEESGALVFDSEHRVAYLPGVSSAFPPPSPNHVTSAVNELSRFPVCPALESYINETQKRLSRETWKSGTGDICYAGAILSALGHRLPEALSKPFGSPGGSPSEALPKQDRDLVPDRDPDKERDEPLSIDLSKPQESFAKGVLRPHGMTIEDWAGLKGVRGPIKPAHLDQILDEYRDKPPEHKAGGWIPPEERGATDEQH